MPPSKYSVTLGEVEQRIVLYTAAQREAAYKARNQTSTYYRPDHHKVTIGYTGSEMAFCMIMNLYPSFALKPEPVDTFLLDGRTVDVKWSDNVNPRLMVKVLDYRKPTDLYALMYGKFPTYSLLGFLEGEKICQPERINYSLPHPAYVALQEELWLPTSVAEIRQGELTRQPTA